MYIFNFESFSTTFAELLWKDVERILFYLNFSLCIFDQYLAIISTNLPIC